MTNADLCKQVALLIFTNEIEEVEELLMEHPISNCTNTEMNCVFLAIIDAKGIYALRLITKFYGVENLKKSDMPALSIKHHDIEFVEYLKSINAMDLEDLAYEIFNAFSFEFGMSANYKLTSILLDDFKNAELGIKVLEAGIMHNEPVTVRALYENLRLYNPYITINRVVIDAAKNRHHMKCAKLGEWINRNAADSLIREIKKTSESEG